jgi:3-oxoacyl-[acyl-carrier-protein] synthase III
MTGAIDGGNAMRRAAITGWGRCTPEPVLSNADLATVMDTSDEWITSRSGIKERRICHVDNSDMATVAGAHALAAAGLSPGDVDYLIVATCTPDRMIPSTACYVQAKLGTVNAAAADINAGCTGFIYGLTMAQGLIAAGIASRILLIGTEKISSYLDLDERSTAVLFGDGAGAVVLQPATGDEGVLSLTVGSDGTLAEALTASGMGTSYVTVDAPLRIIMDGKEIFRHAVVQMGESAALAAKEAEWELEDIDLLIPHQANIRIIDATARRLGLEPSRVFTNIERYGNTSAASIPLALSEALEAGRITPGANLVFVAFGAGLTWGAAAVRWGSRIEPVATSPAALPPSAKSGLEIILDVQEKKRSKA